MIAGGLWEPNPDQLAKFRQAIDQGSLEFKKITQARSFLDIFGGVTGEMLKTAPKGYDRSNPEIELLQLKQIVAMHYYSDNQVLSSDFFDRVISDCRVMKPFLDYLNRIL